MPLIANWRGTGAAGRVTGDLIESTDFVPTLLETAGAPPPAGVKLDGRSFLPQVRGEKGNPRDWVYWWYDPKPGHDKAQYPRTRFARGPRYKLYEDGRFFDAENDPLEAASPVRRHRGRRAPATGGRDQFDEGPGEISVRSRCESGSVLPK